NTSWLEAEIGPSFSVGKGYYAGESTFAISHVISLFEIKSKQLCENHESDTKYEKFRRPEIPSALMALWKKSDSESKNEQNPSTASTAHDSISSSARPEENSYVLSPNLMYGLIFGKQVLQEIEKQPPEDRTHWNEWKEVIDTGLDDVSKGFEFSPKGFGGSLFNSYSASLAAGSLPSDRNPFIKTMEGVAQRAKLSCNIPYYFQGGKQESEEALYRSVNFYRVLWQHTKKAEYKSALVNCLKEVVKEPLGTFHSTDTRADHELNYHHVGNRQFAPYYYYGNAYFIAEAFKTALADEKDPKTKQELNQAKELFGIQLFAQFDTQKKLFIVDEGLPTYPHRVIYQNPLMGLALIPYCEMEL
ncbi:MAG: hypothetical protein ACKOA8_19200, partial [Deltaproteobacteria bacterium]